MNELIRVKELTGGVAVVVLDHPTAKVNTVNQALGDALARAFARLAADGRCVGIVIISGKADSFVVGADIDELARLKTAAEGEALSRSGQQMLDQIAAFPLPVVAAIHGSCLGGGLELALACHGRIASDDGATKLALPEIRLGLIPGAGGTQRLPRLVGVQAALDMILSAKQIPAKKALKLGLLDEIVPAALLEQAACQLARALAAKRAEQATQSRAASELEELRKYMDSRELSHELTQLLLGGNPLGRAMVFRQGRKLVDKKSGGHYPALYAALKAVEAGLAKGIKKGLEVEAREFGKLTVSDVSRRLVELYFATQALKKDSGVARAVTPRPIRTLGVLGGGLMGSGIAFVAAQRGVSVRIKERDHETGALAVGALYKLVKQQLVRRRIDRREAELLQSRVSASPELAGLGRAELVIEAVFEDLALKQRLLKEVEARLAPEAIFASNTSSIPIARIAAAAARPERVLGMHFFSPVEKMPLLEVIVTPETADEATATAVAFGKRLGKQVIVVQDGVGFYTSRILAPYLNEAAQLIAEGARIEDVDRALVEFGFPVGPITLLDEVGIDVGSKVAAIMHEAFGARMEPVSALAAVTADDRKGRKNGRGFYVYGKGKGKGKDKDKEVDVTVYDLLPMGRRRMAIDREEIQTRVALQMVNEALHCLGEGIIRSPRDGDIGAIFGLGFPPFRGGPLRYVDTTGASTVLAELQRLEQRFGARFAPAPALLDAARNHHTFRD